MIGVHKKFDPSTHRLYDRKARNIGKQFFGDVYDVKDNPDIHGPDLMLYSKKTGKFICYFEVEVKTVWTGKFRWPDVNVPERKAKYFQSGKCGYFLISGDYLQGILIEPKVILNSPLKEVPNKYVPRGEYFYKVLTDKVHFVKLK